MFRQINKMQPFLCPPLNHNFTTVLWGKCVFYYVVEIIIRANGINYLWWFLMEHSTKHMREGHVLTFQESKKKKKVKYIHLGVEKCLHLKRIIINYT